jgi:hypothetical protein
LALDGWGRIDAMTARRLLALAATTTIAGLALTSTTGPASARMAEDRCVSGGGAVALSSDGGALAAAAAAGCPLAGRVLTVGHVSVVVPPVGVSVAGDGVGRHGEVRGVTVTNTGHGVRVHREGGSGGWYLAPLSSSSTSTPPTTTSTTTSGVIAARPADPPACQDRTFNLEHHKWGRSLRYRIDLRGMPKRFARTTVLHQIRAANKNMRTGRNTCGRARIATPTSHYLGRTHARPDIAVKGPTCKAPDGRNVVGFGNLPGGLLGWTCYWWGSNGRMLQADMMIDNGKYLATKLPSTCTDTWDFEGTVTHEWGHAYGLAHTGNGHANLTMQHLLTPCSTYARTLGLGDWLGMNKMYGHRR